jgi:hypothetical protein
MVPGERLTECRCVSVSVAAAPLKADRGMIQAKVRPTIFFDTHAVARLD